jgi:hypothetical protein
MVVTEQRNIRLTKQETEAWAFAVADGLGDIELMQQARARAQKWADRLRLPVYIETASKQILDIVRPDYSFKN